MSLRDRPIDHLPYAAALAVGLALRLHGLGGTPLSSAEAGASWAAWSVATEGPPALASLAALPESAALFGLQCGIFWLFGGAGGDAVARLGPALVGSAMVVLPWLARRGLGRPSAVSLTLMLALDPWLVGSSRLAEGAILAAAAAWTAVVGLRALEAPDGYPPIRRRHWSAGVWVAAGILAITGPAGWNLLPPVAIAIFACRDSLVPALRHSDSRWLAVVAALVVATTGLAQWHGPALWSASLDRWLDFARDGVSLATLARLVTRYELWSLALGVAGFLSWRRRSRGAGRVWPGGSTVLTLWIAWGAWMILRPGRGPAAWLVLQLPLVLSAASLAGRLAVAARRKTWARTPLYAGVLVAGLLGVVALHGTLAISGNRRPVPFGTGSDATDPAVRLLARDLDDLRPSLPPGSRAVSILIAPRREPDPVLAWYLRSDPDVRWEASSAGHPAARRHLVVEPVSGARGYPLRRDGQERMRVRLRELP